MARFTVGCVPYVNAIPLVYPFEALGDESPVRVVYDVPSKLPAMLETCEAQAILVSIFDPLTVPDRSLVMGVGIGSDGPVQSVRLFSKKPLDAIKTLALDASSMTSNALARIVLRESYGVTPACKTAKPNLGSMLESFDACVLIGDAGMEAESDGLTVVDLGDAWRRLMGLPFVWAGWVGGPSLDMELAELLRDAFLEPSKLGVPSTVEDWVRAASENSPFGKERLSDYFENAMRYEMDSRSLEGIARYRTMLASVGVSETFSPKFVGAEFMAPIG